MLKTSCCRQFRGLTAAAPSAKAARKSIFVAMIVVVISQTSFAQTTGTVDQSNIGLAVEDSVISSGLPTTNLETRTFNVANAPQQLMNTLGEDYPNAAAAGAAQEYMIFKFDLSTLPAGAQATATGSFDFSAWFTLGENGADEPTFGQFRFFEITAGDAAWQDRYADGSGLENPNPVTFNSLNGTFVDLTSAVQEDDTLPANNQFGPFGVLHPGILVSNGGFDGANRVVNIPIDTLNRLISGQSIGLAMGSVPPNTAPPEGDYDGDLDADGNDFLLWQQTLGNTVAAGTGADGDGDGTIGAGDLAVWTESFGETGGGATAGRTNFSIHTSETFFNPNSVPSLNFDWSAPAIAVTAATPEPASIALAAGGLALLLAQRRIRLSRV